MRYSLFFCLLFLLSNPFDSNAQDNLVVSKAFYERLSSGGSKDFIAAEKFIVVPNGKVWKVTNAKVFMTYDNRMIDDKTYLYLDEQIITYATLQYTQITDPIWLPAGKYRLTIRTEEKNKRDGRFEFNGFVSGLEYELK